MRGDCVRRKDRYTPTHDATTRCNTSILKSLNDGGKLSWPEGHRESGKSGRQGQFDPSAAHDELWRLTFMSTTAIFDRGAWRIIHESTFMDPRILHVI